ncbi:MAG: recombinase A [Polyangiaceae bacterium]|jgi:recombination protein RecA
MSTALDVKTLLTRLGHSHDLRLAKADDAFPSLPLVWPELNDVLPDGGLPCGVVELTAPGVLGGSTSIALAAVRAGQRRSLTAWCAWVDPEGTLHAPGVVAAGVDLSRLLVVRPPRLQLGRVAVKVTAAGAFDVVVVDVDVVMGAISKTHDRLRPNPPAKKGWAPEVLVRKLALAAESSGTTVILLTDSSRPRAAVWPVALRLELGRPDRSHLMVRIAKDRRGRVGLAKVLPFQPISRATG